MNRGKLGIFVGGGPAPGINGVICAAAIEAHNNGLMVIGFYDGLKHLAAAEFEPWNHVTELSISEVSRIHFDGGSILRTSRTSLLDVAVLKTSMVVQPDEQKTARVCDRLKTLGITHLLSIGGDDTALSARFIAEHLRGAIRVVHVPKTIDNDLPLPPDVNTFGFNTARHHGSEIVANLMEDSRTTRRWYFVVAMGRNAGFLALEIGKAAGTTISIIPEEFQGTTTIKTIADILEGAMLKRRVMGRDDGVAIMAEGLAYKLGDRDELARLLGKEVPVDAAGHPRLAEIPLGHLLKEEVTRRFKERKDDMTIVSHNLGYELRCARPATSDLVYTRDLGHGGVRLLLNGDTKLPAGVMVTLQGGNLVPVPFDAMIDPTTHRTRIRKVDLSSYSYSVARAYMIRLERSDFADALSLSRLAKQAGLTPDQFRDRFEHVAAMYTRETRVECACNPA